MRYTSGSIQAGLPVYVLDGDAYTGYNSTSNAGGQTGLTLPIGNYRFRSDKNGTQFWSDTANDCTVPGCTTVTVTLAPLVSVVDTSGAAAARLPFYTHFPLFQCQVEQEPTPRSENSTTQKNAVDQRLCHKPCSQSILKVARVPER